jgi:NAD(P)-dependent dehydrogenase (short-subunit alcohol dehydrogenase family)
MSLRVEELFSVAGKVVLVTGGSRGIGEMIARGFAANGARVYVSSRKADVCRAIADELSRDGECIAVPADLSRMDEVERLASELRAREPKLHVLVNNAGASWGQSFDLFSEQGWDRVIDLNLKALFFLTQRLIEPLVAAGTADDPARVINIGSIDGLQASPTESFSYSASKAGVHQLTKHMARFLADRHVNVNAIAPGFFPSKMTAYLAPHEAKFLRFIPLARTGRPDDMAGAALYLSSRAGAYLTGSVVTVDGGLLSASRKEFDPESDG